MPKLRVALAQTNPVVGAFKANSDAALDAARRAHEAGADILALGEMALSGYPIEDLATRPAFLEYAHAEVLALAKRLAAEGYGDLPVVIGFPDGPFDPRPEDVSTSPSSIAQNCAAVLFGGELVARQAKFHLPNYSVFDEYRIFIPGDTLTVVRIGDVDVALAVCEDLWRDGGPVSRVASADAGVLLVINASPYERDKDEVRLPLVTRRALETDTVVAYVNIVGGQDDLVFDGDSVVVDQQGRILARAPQFVEHLLIVDVDAAAATAPKELDTHLSGGLERIELPKRSAPKPPLATDIAVLPDDLEQIWNALVLGLADYVGKIGFPSVILGLSGGIDSSVVAALAADAIGPDRVFGVSMPSRYSSEGSRSDSDDLAERIGLVYSTEAIENLVSPFETQLNLDGLAAENIQARVRGMILMALSNQNGHLVLTTGNKSELSVGYSTIYGDSVGGFNPIKDVPKMLVWELARWRNRAAIARGDTPPIPENSIEKPPSAELRVDQTDQQTLPSYEDLDAILELYITQRKSRADVLAAGYDEHVVDQVITLTDRAEWKRRQSAIGPKISQMAFGRDRRLPIVYAPGA